MSAPAVDTDTMSPECAVAQLSGYEDLHGECRQTEDIPLPHGGGIILIRRCQCTCHSVSPFSGHSAGPNQRR